MQLLERFASMASVALDNAQLHTRLQQELDELEKKEATIRTIFDATTDAILAHDVETAEMVTLNRKAEELFGITLEKAKQIGIEKIDSLLYNGRLAEIIKNVPDEGSQLIEWAPADQKGDRLQLEINHRRAKIDGTECAVAVIRDISERKEMEAELTRTHNQKLALLRTTPDLMLLVNRAGVLLEYNKATYSELRVPPEDCIGTSVTAIFPANLTQKVLGLIHQTIDTGTIQLLDYQLLINNRAYYFETRFVKSGKDEALAIVRDITYRKQMEQQLEYLVYAP